ncbi:TPA: hypothetical protein ACSTNG_001719 [Serratia fonticola]
MKHNRNTGELDGTPQEIHDFYQNMGFNADQIFTNKNKARIVLPPALLFILMCILIVCISPETKGEDFYNVLIIISIAFMMWLVCSIQYCYTSWLVTVISLVFGVLLLLYSTKQINLKTISTISQDAAKSYMNKNEKN